MARIEVVKKQISANVVMILLINNFICMVFLLGIVGHIKHFPAHGAVRREMSALFVLDSTLGLSHPTFRIAALTALWVLLVSFS
jgi:hypothetical protein